MTLFSVVHGIYFACNHLLELYENMFLFYSSMLMF